MTKCGWVSLTHSLIYSLPTSKAKTRLHALARMSQMSHDNLGRRVLTLEIFV